MGLLRSMLDAIARSRSHRAIRKQFMLRGFAEIQCPDLSELLPFRYRQIVRYDNVCLFAKGDTQMLVVPVAFLPRTRTPHRGRTFVLLSMPLDIGDPATRRISAALRSAGERFSIVDQLDMDSYPSLSPLPDYILFAADDASARKLLNVVTPDPNQRQSLILHNGRLFAQVSA